MGSIFLAITTLPRLHPLLLAVLPLPTLSHTPSTARARRLAVWSVLLRGHLLRREIPERYCWAARGSARVGRPCC